MIARIEAERHGASLVLQLASDLPWVNADPVQLQQVLLNLVRNAAEAMASIEPGARKVVVSTTATAPRQIAISVADAGPTIDDAVFERLFTPFCTTKTDGLGMGLAISRSIIEAHGGRLWGERRAGAGLVIRFTLPAETRPDSVLRARSARRRRLGRRSHGGPPRPVAGSGSATLDREVG